MKTSKIFKGMINLVKGSIAAAIALHIGTCSVYCINNAANLLRPSHVRQEFTEEFGFPIHGWKSDIEENLSAITLISEVVDKERLEGHLDLRSITIRPGSYFKKSAIQQIEQLISGGSMGSYDPIVNTIDIERNSGPSIVHHEIKHAKTHGIMDKHPEFLERWRDLAKGGSGNSLYLSVFEKGVREGLMSLIDDEKSDLEENVKLGFVTNYARTNVYEDIAELCEMAEGYPYQFQVWLGKGEERNTKIAAKVELAEEYGLIPAEFTEYIKIRQALQDVYGSSGEIASVGKAEETLGESEKFLENHPDTLYRGNLRCTMANILGRKGLYDKAIEEYKLAIASPYKDTSSYANALDSLSSIYKGIKDEKRSSLYREAYDEYFRRRKNGDVHLSRNGINDFLIAKGEELK